MVKDRQIIKEEALDYRDNLVRFVSGYEADIDLSKVNRIKNKWMRKQIEMQGATFWERKIADIEEKLEVERKRLKDLEEKLERKRKRIEKLERSLKYCRARLKSIKEG